MISSEWTQWGRIVNNLFYDGIFLGSALHLSDAASNLDGWCGLDKALGGLSALQKEISNTAGLVGNLGAGNDLQENISNYGPVSAKKKRCVQP